MDLKKKIAIIASLSILLIFTICITCNADASDIIENPGGYNLRDETVDSRVSDKISTILTVTTNIGIILSVLMSAAIGIKYMMASLEERADYKESLVPYLIGIAILFGTCTIVKVVQGIGTTINTM